MIVEHTHLAQGQEREILPWLRLSAELDPQRIDTYTVAAYWLRGRMGKVKEAEEFLRDGLRANPQSSAILFELGKLYSENNHDAPRARGVWELALLRWQENETKQKEPDTFLLNEIAMNLAHAEEEAGELDGAITHLGIALTNSPSAEMIAKEIAELKAKRAARPSP